MEATSSGQEALLATPTDVGQTGYFVEGQGFVFFFWGGELLGTYSLQKKVTSN